ncbi:MAG: PadR family transcriptional regulator [Nocardioides sp.]|uniref:PadR family transcriptional regulator n=1 Tax=Nocardioides sp. TaxID=35761 RepID=UPI003EFC8742
MNDDWNSHDHYRRHRSRGQQWGNPFGQGFGNAFGPGGPPAWLQEMFGMGQPPRPSRGPRVRRGDVRTAIIDVLHRAGQAEESINGYQVIQQIADLSDGEWRPSPGSVYPTISQLEDEGLVTSDDERGRRSLRLTPEGVAWAEAHTADLDAVWAPFQRTPSPSRFGDTTSGDESGSDDPGRRQGADFKSEITQVMSAAWQLVTQGSESQRRAALEVLADTRRSLYGILADGRGEDQRP